MLQELMAKLKAKGPRHVARQTNALPVSRPQAVRLLGVSDRTFARLEAEGVIAAATPRHGRRASSYDAVVLVRNFIEHREQKLTDSIESPRDRRDRSHADLNELRLARERNELLPRERVVLEGQAFVTAIVAKIRALPSRLLRAGVLAHAAVPLCEELLREAQDEIARWRTYLDLLSVVDDKGRA
jgi:hypothetical protein